MGRLEAVLLLGAALVAVGAVPASLMEDTKQAQLHSSGKVKRAQEVMMFGNQQNRPSEAAYFQGLKRGEDGEVGEGPMTKTLLGDGFQDADEEDGGDSMRPEDGGKSPAQYEKGYRYGVGKEALDKHTENALLKSELFGEPSSVNQYRYYGGGERRGMQEAGFAPPSKRSGVSSFRPMVPRALPSTPRLKRDLELDPEDVLALLSLWEAEHRRQKPLSYRPESSSWSHLNGPEPSEDFEAPEENDQADGEEDNPNAGGWWEGPVYPSAPSNYPAHFSLDKRLPLFYPPPGAQYPLFAAQKREGQWGGFAKDKRSMVTRKRQAPPRDGVHSLAQLLNSTPRREPGVPVLRRMVL